MEVQASANSDFEPAAKAPPTPHQLSPSDETVERHEKVVEMALVDGEWTVIGIRRGRLAPLPPT